TQVILSAPRGNLGLGLLPLLSLEQAYVARNDKI
ncbi:unnamed protein product, partial [marine sediment metagenome]